MAKKKVKLAIDTRRSTMPEREFSEQFELILKKMPPYLKDMMMRYNDQHVQN